MKKLPFRNIMLWLTILTLLWSGQGQGYVWCMTAEGAHLESPLANHCGSGVPPLAAPELNVETFGAEDTSCNPCVDLAATHDTLQQRTLSGSDDGSPFHLSAIVHPHWAPAAFVRKLDNNLILEDPPRVATTLLLHRTIVLLI